MDRVLLSVDLEHEGSHEPLEILMMHTTGVGAAKRDLRTARPAADPASVADRVRQDHETIRALLDDLERACAAAKDRRPGGLDQYRQAVWDLYVAFDEHLVMEEVELAPVLRAVEAWGEVGARNMILEHNEQRRILLELVEDTECEAKPIDGLAAQAAALVAGFRADMAIEDRALAAILENGSIAPREHAGDRP